MSISEARYVVHNLVDGGTALPVLRWLPGSADELPCYVVGRPDLTEGDQRAMQAITVPVYALGRTLRDDVAQAELDTMADTLVGLLWKPPQHPSMTLRLTRLRAITLTVAAVEIPAYTASVDITVVAC